MTSSCDEDLAAPLMARSKMLATTLAAPVLAGAGRFADLPVKGIDVMMIHMVFETSF